MDAYDYFKRGYEYLEKGDYTQANENFWKAQAMVFDPEVVALSSMEALRQALGITD